MDRNKKEELVGELHDKFSNSEATFLLEYRGITVGSMTDLRGKLRDVSVDLSVVRNTLAKKALEGTPIEGIKDNLVGPVAVAFSKDDVAQAAKVITEFAKDEPKLKLILGTLGEKTLDITEINNLASLPSRDVLLAKIVGVLNGVPTSLVGVLGALPRKLLYALRAIEATKQ